ncbi:outer membrane adhesin like protein (plasmid) [Rhizobium leguminosarum bv. trifolii WSM2304]|uniref:Outer membrane adhesin like protein n=1 Tax=Rhizobium leguminosarum bv. trifolii (strain WSM2304) TaxID=395492 RepID=A0ABF7QY41_RHILW|nr:outer membrane adhesin like protein [Rhizobium leguminosarum bv. trifolii WSM2304]
MYRNARRWTSRSLLLDSLVPRWLTVGGKERPRKPGKHGDGAQLAVAVQTVDGNKQAPLVDDPHKDVALNEHDARQNAAVNGDADRRADDSPAAPPLPDAFTINREIGERSGDITRSVLSAQTPDFAHFAPDANRVAFAAASSFPRTYAGMSSIGDDPLASYLPQGSAPTASGQASAAVTAERTNSGKVVILESAPSAQSAGQHAGANALAFGMPFGVCGCGYYTSPTRILDWAHGGALLQQDGQLPGTKFTDGPDYVSAAKKAIGASVSDPLLDRDVSPFAGWRATAALTDSALLNGSLPGGGEMGTGTGTKGRAVLSGSVTTPPQPSAQRSLATQDLAAAAAVASNAIVLENQKQGNPESEWGIDTASTNIEGFATDISVDNGSTINFKINTNSTNYRIDIYRLGYYGGMGARKVTTIQHTGLQTQPNPLRNATTGTVDAGNWAVSASWAVPSDAVSGVYIAKLVRQDGTFGENQIPFIVRDDASHSDIVFQTADETWQAYNGWGGANFYGGNGPATGQGAGRAYALSYNRPIATRDGVGTYAGPQDYLFGAEYAGIYWLEQNGYDVSYLSGIDVDRYGSLLLNHKTYVDAGHDEYWSGQQRTNVEAARDAGVNLMFWSGNEVYWRTRWGNAYSADGTPYRTLISYKETWGPPGTSLDPSNEWTGTFRDPRLSPPAIGGGNPENSLTGQLFKVDDVGGNLGAITVGSDDANLRFWRNTSVANLQPGQTATLTKNYLGYEWDEAPDNGFDPAGLVKLSSTTLPVNTYLLDYGNTTGSATATHNLTLYRAPSGALVFGAGTVYWTWGLSNNHDNEATPTDPRVQQAMVNLLADMGIQPGTLQSGLTATTGSADTVAPTSVITVPATVVANSTVTISGTAADTGGGVIASVEVSTDNGASWHPATGDENWTYSWTPAIAGTYTIRSRAVDDSINLETPSAGRTVTVTGPTFTSLFGGATPAVVNTDDNAAVELGVKFQSSVAGTVSGIRFYKSSLDTGTHTGSLWSSTGTRLATLTFTNETASGWQSATFSSPVTLTAGQTYTASYHTNVGNYSTTANYFLSNVTSGPLTAPASGNGVYNYSSASAFPTNSFDQTNYWVDVMFNPSNANNTTPTAVADAGDATEKGGVANGSGGAVASGNVLTNDTDPDAGDTKTVTAIKFGATSGTLGTALAGTYGSLVLNASGAYTYTINETNAAVQGLRLSTNTLSEVFNYTMRDTAGATATANLTVTIHGANDAPVLAVQTATQNATVNSAFSFAVPTTTFTDVDSSETLTYSATAADGTALPSWLSFNASTRTFSGTPTTGGTYGVKVTATDIGGLAANETFNIAVSVPGNTTPTAVADVGDATEKGGVANGSGGAVASGNVLTNDTDPDAGDTKTVTAVNFGATSGTLGSALNGTYGSLVLNASGAYSYAINESNATVQALRLSTNTLNDVFSYTMRDTAGTTATANLTITIHGANDAPVLAVQTATQNATVGSAFSFAVPTTTFTDVDSGETLTYSATAADGTALPAWLSFNATTRTFSGTPTAAGTYGVKVTATDIGGLSANETFNIAAAAGPSTYSLFSASSTPAQANLNDGQQLELGVKFTSNVAGDITGIRFYRSANDNGQNVVDLWSSTGTKLATATFTNTTASGWQTANFTTPFTITANTAYVASYHTTGAYVATANFFTAAVTSGPLTAAASGNGVYRYGGSATAGIFPNATFGATNYWADVVFRPTNANNTTPTAVADAGDATEKGGVANGSGGAVASGNVLTNDTDPDAGDTKTVTAIKFGATSGTLGTALAGTYGSLVLNASGAYTYTINETNAAVQGLRLSTNTLSEVFNYTMRDTAGATATANLTVTIHGANDAPVLAVQTATQNATVNSAFSFAVPTTTFTDVDSSETLTYSATAADGTALPSWLSFNASTRTFSGTPTTGGTYGVKVTATDIGGLAANETFNIAVSVPGNTTPTAVADVGDATEKGGVANGSGGAVASGNVLTNDTDPDAGDTKTVTAVNFGATSGTLGSALNGTYGSLVLNASGAYSYAINESNATVQALRLSTNTLNDVFSYTMRDTAGTTATANLTITIHGANDAPVLAVQTATQNATVGSAFSFAVPTTTFTDVDSGETLTYSATAADGTALPAWLSFNATTRTFSGTPTAAGTYGVKVTATDIGGLSANETFNIAAAAGPSTYSLFSASSTPAQANLNDGQQLELGVKFTSNVAGDITGIRFYRSANDNGQNVVDLWSSTGTKLATATFTNTTASGWQTANFTTPFTITANTTYVASYHTTGAYVATDSFFTAAVTNGPLTAPASGNGLYAYGGSATAGLFPTSTFNSANYYADVVFRPQLAA